MRSRKAQNEIYDKLGITVRADAFFKRAIAERSIREIKLRMAIHLDFEGRRENRDGYNSNNSMCVCVYSQVYIFLNGKTIYPMWWIQ